MDCPRIKIYLENGSNIYEHIFFFKIIILRFRIKSAILDSAMFLWIYKLQEMHYQCIREIWK